jgi:hypothetical protein
VARPTKLTALTRAEFLGRLADNGGSVTDAAAHIGMNRVYLYEYRDKDNSTCRKFKADWAVAQKVGDRRLRDEAIRRAFDGVPEPVIYQGVVSKEIDPETKKPVPLTVIKYSDTLMVRMLAAKFPEFRTQRVETKGVGNGTTPSNVIMFIPDNGRVGPDPEDGSTVDVQTINEQELDDARNKD